MIRLVVECFRRPVSLEAPAGLVSSVDALLPHPPWRSTTRTPERIWTAERSGAGWDIRAGGEWIGSSSDQTEAARLTRGDIELWVAQHAVGRAVVHACVVTTEGAALLVPGPSMAGKTTLALALVEAGADYFSDEFAVLDDAGLVHPYCRRPSVRRHGRSVDHLPIDEFGGSVCGEPVPVRLIADLAFRPGTSGLSIAELPSPQAVLALIANAVAARTQPTLVLDAAAAAVATARAVRGERGEASTAAPALLDLLRAAAAAA